MNNATQERWFKIARGTGNVLAIVVLVLLAIDPTRNLYPIFCMLIPAVVLEVVSYRIGRPNFRHVCRSANDLSNIIAFPRL